MEIAVAAIIANIFILGFNIVGMGIMTYQLDDFLEGKRKDIYGPPSIKVYVAMWAAVFLVAYLFMRW
jgi:hypothetical protein